MSCAISWHPLPDGQRGEFAIHGNDHFIAERPKYRRNWMARRLYKTTNGEAQWNHPCSSLENAKAHCEAWARGERT